MEITEIRLFPVNHGEQLKAYVTIILDDCFVIRGLKIIQGPKGYFLAMPTRKNKNGDYVEIVSTISAEARKMLEEKVLADYERIIGEPVTRRVLK